ncbi:putative ferulic acid Esterase/Feruloyl esterase [Xylaria intraflava]|nr:putative ferulic acid Esterase/Feruloyl esterase [Xylaria intraflava]
MYRYDFVRLLAACLASLGVAAASSSTHDERDIAFCNEGALASVLPAGAKIERVQAVAAGSTYGEGPADLAYPIQPTNLPALCAVTVEVASSATSSYRVGLFLPQEWNNRFLAIGNGGFGGGINWLDMGAAAHYGFAVVSTDTGHNSLTADGRWALNNAEAKTDWGWRAVHGSVVLGKLLTQAYYTQSIAYSYYSGCSTGGRQGLKEVQMFPDSFDGVLVGSAAWDTNHLNNWVTQAATYNWPADDEKHIDWHLLPAIGVEITKQCDNIDGVADGIISLPGLCNVDFEALSCEGPGANKSACLTAPQAQTLRNVYSNWTADGELLYTGLLPGSEGQMYAVLSYPDASPYGIGYARYFVLNNASFAFADFNDSLVSIAEQMDPGNATADDYDLTAFRQRGGKMIMYHGAADGLVPTRGSDLYYERVVKGMGGNMTETQEFFKYFMVPGMQHCAETLVDAPWAFGGASQASFFGNDTWSVPGFVDAQHDILLNLLAWRENATTNQVVATTWNTPTNTSSGVLRQRPLCPYPQMAIWDENGPVNDAKSWSCGGDIRIRPVPSSRPVPTSEARHWSWTWSSCAAILVASVLLIF